MLFQTRCAGCDTPGTPLCPTCRFALLGRPGDGPADVVTAVPFSGRARRVILGLKYRNRRRVARHLAGVLVNRLVEAGAHGAVDVVTWAPTTARRSRERGFDQAEAIARTVARQLGLPCRRLLDRPADIAPQTGRTRADRLDRPRFRAGPVPHGATVLVVDDVVTTGATLRAARTALLERGAAEVMLAAVAATPPTRRAAVVPLTGYGRAATPSAA